jgi:hypothetical protein
VTKKSLPPDVVDSWPEVFSDIDVHAIPLDYLHSVRVIFENGKVWDIDIARYAKKAGTDDLDQHLEELFKNYEEEIAHIDFRLNVAKVKKDIIKKTKSFLKKPKTKT